MTRRPWAVAALACLALAACSSGPGMRRGAGRELELRADPSRIVATEFAFAQAAQEDGQWTAFEDYAASNALIFGRHGAIDAKPWLKQQKDPPQAMTWRPHAVWSSCDGSLAVTRGGYQSPDGEVGTFYTVWERDRGTEYKWIFDFGFPTETAEKAPLAIPGNVADCPARGAAAPPLPSIEGRNIRHSKDGTLAWTFLIAGDPAVRSFTVWSADKGEMRPVIEEAVPSSGQQP